MSRLWTNDEELAKKNDDLTDPRLARRNHSQGQQWQSAGRVPRRSSIARFAIYALIAFLLVIGLTKLLGGSSASGGGGGSSRINRPNSDPYSLDGIPTHGSGLDNKPPPAPAPAPPSADSGTIGGGGGGSDGKGGQAETARTYSGPLKLPSLGQSLHAIGSLGGKQPKNRNVLFTAGSLRSAATLLPFACQMAYEHLNYVHFVLMGRSEISLLDLLKINGIEDSCPLYIHDGRPDLAMTSTQSRMTLAATRAIYYINLYMHPQAIFVDSTSDEEQLFLSAVRDEVRGTPAALIELPERPGDTLAWATKLDSSALNAWDKVHVDIVVHATPNGSENIKRLLTSLAKSDLGALPTPHLTVELPPTIEPQVESFLEGFQWPPIQDASSRQPNMLTLRHRIPRQKLTDEESSVRFLESFWPAQPANSHVLVLSPHTEVSPQFFHYLKYTLLQHRYSSTANNEDLGDKMLGISFASPKNLLDSSQPLNVPQKNGEPGWQGAFLWQAPSSDSLLVSGERWVELHGLISQVLEKQHSSSQSPVLLAHKEVSKQYPSWLEYILQLSRLRGYYTLYPGSETASVVMGVHNDLPELPEEYGSDQEAHDEAFGDDFRDRATLLFDPYSRVNILATLRGDGTLPPLIDLPVLSWDGKSVSGVVELEDKARVFATQFRREVGQCAEDEEEKAFDRYARDLFCTSTS